MIEVIKFSELSEDEKVDICTMAHRILTRFHGKSSFIANNTNEEISIERYAKLIKNFKGSVAFDSFNNVMFFYKKVRVKDCFAVREEFKRAAASDPVEGGNAVYIDFFVAEANKNNKESVARFLSKLNVSFAVYNKKGSPHVEQIEALLGKIEKMPVK